MSLKDDWKNTGKNLGNSFKDLGKSIARSAKTGVGKVDDAVEGREKQPGESNVFNDGTWRKTGKNLGGAFAGLGKSIVKSARVGIDKVDDSISKKDRDE